ncbi:glutaredoxin-like protein NrdH [Microbacterium sp. C23T]
MDKLTVYSKPGCVQCAATYRALDSHGIPYDIVDLTDNPAALAYVTDELGYSQAPVVVASDQDHWSGFRPDHIDRIART